MAKIRYTIDLRAPGYPVIWIDQTGARQREMIETTGINMLDEIHAKFKGVHPGAIYLTSEKLERFHEKMLDDKAKMAAWEKGLPL